MAGKMIPYLLLSFDSGRYTVVYADKIFDVDNLTKLRGTISQVQILTHVFQFQDVRYIQVIAFKNKLNRYSEMSLKGCRFCVRV
jgi:hypothetical protein